MNSFDFYDTLVARKTVVDAHLMGHDEIMNLIPITENISKVQPEDIIISDYDYPEVVKKGVKFVCGLDNEVYISQDGKLTGEIWKRYKPIAHIGDNVHSDYSVPKIHGIECKIVTNAKLTQTEAFLEARNLPQLSNWIRQTRLRTYNEEFRSMELLQIELNFPLLYLASILLHRKLDGFTDVLMSSRDCALWTTLQQKVKEAYKGLYNIHYFYTSRKARRNPSESYLDYVRNLCKDRPFIVDLCGYGETLPILMDKVGCDAPIWLLGKYSHKVPNRTKSFLNIVESYIERLNVARHPCVVDVINGYPIYSNPADINWSGSERIKVAHTAFSEAVSLVDSGCDLSDNEILRVMQYFIDKIAQNKAKVLMDDVVLKESLLEG